jgi:cell division transport system permease protein
LLAFSCVVIVANTIQLTIWARRDEIEILRLVGATERFVEAPFLIEGVLQGIVGSAIGVALLGVLYQVLFVQLRETMGLALGARVLTFLPPAVWLTFLAAGLLLGLVGSWLGVRRMLDRSR